VFCVRQNLGLLGRIRRKAGFVHPRERLTGTLKAFAAGASIFVRETESCRAVLRVATARGVFPWMVAPSNRRWRRRHGDDFVVGAGPALEAAGTFRDRRLPGPAGRGTEYADEQGRREWVGEDGAGRNPLLEP
jgi:hypothetical protein